MQRRQQGLAGQIEDLANEAHVIVDQRAITAVLFNAGGQGLAVTQGKLAITQLLQQPHHQGGLAAEWFTGPHQECGAGVAHGLGSD